MPEVAILQQLQIHNRIRVPPFPPHKECQRDQGQHEGHGDVAIAKPVLFLTLIEDEFQAANADCHQAQPDSIDGVGFRSFLHQVRRILHHVVAEQQGNDADRQVDEEDPMPIEVVGDPAAQRRTDRGCGHHCHAIEGECLASLFHRKRVREDGLFAGSQSSTAKTLQDPGQNKKR